MSDHIYNVIALTQTRLFQNLDLFVEMPVTWLKGISKFGGKGRKVCDKTERVK